MALPVDGSRVRFVSYDGEDRIGSMLLNGNIDRALAGNQKAAALLGSDALRDFLAAFPDYKIGEFRLPPFFKRDVSPDIERLIACVLCQWTRDFITTKRTPTERIAGIGPNSVEIWRDQIPELLGLIFDDEECAFLELDVRLQQTLVLMAQDFFEAIFPECPLPQGFHMLVRELETTELRKKCFFQASLIELAADKLEKLDNKAPEGEARAAAD